MNTSQLLCFVLAVVISPVLAGIAEYYFRRLSRLVQRVKLFKLHRNS